MDTNARLKTIFEGYFAEPIEAFGDRTSPEQVEKWDSTAHVGLVLEIEREFGIEFTPKELGLLTSVGAIRELIDKKLPA